MQLRLAAGLVSVFVLNACGPASPRAELSATAEADEAETWRAHADAERGSSLGFVGLPTGAVPRNPGGTRHPWPVPVLSIGHTNASYQNYGGAPYFHHGLDIRADAGDDVLAAAGGTVVNIENYGAGSAYWEIAILDDEGYLWQYHHVDHGSIPQAVTDAYRDGTRVESGAKLGEVYYWSVVTYGERYHHIHLNVLGAGGQFVSPFDFLQPLSDTQAPQFVAVGLLQNGRAVAGNTVTGRYSVYAQIHDLIQHQQFVVPPHVITYAVDGGAAHTVWDFSTLPGGASEEDYVEDFFVPAMTCGDYSCRKLVVDLGFDKAGEAPFTAAAGTHTVHVVARDYAGNETGQDFAWTVR